MTDHIILGELVYYLKEIICDIVDLYYPEYKLIWLAIGESCIEQWDRLDWRPDASEKGITDFVREMLEFRQLDDSIVQIMAVVLSVRQLLIDCTESKTWAKIDWVGVLRRAGIPPATVEKMNANFGPRVEELVMNHARRIYFARELGVTCLFD